MSENISTFLLSIYVFGDCRVSRPGFQNQTLIGGSDEELSSLSESRSLHSLKSWSLSLSDGPVIKVSQMQTLLETSELVALCELAQSV